MLTNKKKAIIFGAGGVGVDTKLYLEENGYQIVNFIDNNQEKWGEEIEGITITDPMVVKKKEYDVIAIGVYKAVDLIKEQLVKMGVSVKHIIVPILPDRIFYNDKISIDKKPLLQSIVILSGCSNKTRDMMRKYLRKNFVLLDECNFNFENKYSSFHFLSKELYDTLKNSVVEEPDCSHSGGKKNLNISAFIIENLGISKENFYSQIQGMMDKFKKDYELTEGDIIYSSSSEEFINLCNILCSKQTMNFINQRIPNDCEPELLEKIEELRNEMNRNNIPLSQVCVVSGAVLQAYGIRESKLFDDIDIIMTSDFRKLYGTGLVIVSKSIEMHIQDEFDVCDDEIIMNENYHFHLRGIKFMNIDILYRHRVATNNSEYKLIERYYKRISE